MSDARALYFLLPGDPTTRTGGYLYDARVAAELARHGWRVHWRRLPGDFPQPSDASLCAAERALAALPDQALVLIDGLAFGAMPGAAEKHAQRLRLVALVHHPLADETGLDAVTRARLWADERAALRAARRVIVTSPLTARALQQRYAVTHDRLGVVIPGTEPAPLTRARANARGLTTLRLLCVATLTPRKGHALLLRALAPLRRYRWQLTCAGSPLHDRRSALRTRLLSCQLGLQRRVTFCGELDAARLRALYRRSDLFVLASYHEGFGMALSEALARGLPAVVTAGGALADTLPAGAGLLTPPGDRRRLSAALRRVLADPALRRRLARGAAAARRTQPDWAEAGRRFAAELALGR